MQSTIPEVSAAKTASSHKTAQTIELNAYYYADRVALLPELTSALTRCGGWVLDRRTLSPTAMEFVFEIQLAGVLDLYGALVGVGLELTRAAHTFLTDLCTCRKHSAASPNPGQIVMLKLNVSFLADVTLHSILMTGSSHA